MIISDVRTAEMVEFIHSLNKDVFSEHGYTKDDILENKDGLFDRLLTSYQKDVDDCECDVDWSLEHALEEVFGIFLSNLSSHAVQQESVVKDHSDIVSMVLHEVNTLKTDWIKKASLGFLSSEFADTITIIPDSLFVSTFLEIIPDSPEDIAALIKSEILFGKCYDRKDLQGFNKVWVFRLNDTIYQIEISSLHDVPFEQQAADEIWKQYCHNKKRAEL